MLPFFFVAIIRPSISLAEHLRYIFLYRSDRLFGLDIRYRAISDGTAASSNRFYGCASNFLSQREWLFKSIIKSNIHFMIEISIDFPTNHARN